MIALRKFIDRYSELSEADWQIISHVFERKVFEKNETILAEGNICNHFWFLEEGLVRFYITTSGDDITKFFTLAPYCFTAKNSFRHRTSSEEGIQAVERAVTWQTTYLQILELAKIKSWDTFIRKFNHEVQSYTEELLWEIKTQTAEQRYKKMLEAYPEVARKIPLKYLSGFLGIAPQSLSRIRKNGLK